MPLETRLPRSFRPSHLIGTLFAKPYHAWEPRKTLAFKPLHDIFVKSPSTGFARVAQ
ncbi:MAG: hypothetical protein Q8O92_12745 [Candidatus Latescibacter sp.]|nr:hypothetical protein [Candidatus Latescibacter sp.]